MGWITNNTDDCPVLIPLNVWNSPEFSGAIGPIGNGEAFLDADCKNYDNEQVRLLDPYWDQPDCWEIEAASNTIYYFSKTAGDEVVTAATTRVTTGPDGPFTIVELTTLGSDVTTITLGSGRVITTTRGRGDVNAAPAIVTTLTNSLGRPTATTTSLAFGLTQRTTPFATLRDPSGRPTTTIFSPEPLSSRLITLSDSQGTPTLTLTEYFRPRPTTPVFPSGPTPYRPPKDKTTDPDHLYRPLSPTTYFSASFLPVILTTLLTILLKTVRSTIHSLLPFHALTRPGGSAAPDSLCLQPGGSIRALRTGLRCLTTFKEPVSFLADLVFVMSAVLVWLSTEAVGVVLVGNCTVADFYGCFLTVAVVEKPARAAEGVLVGIAVLVGVIGALMRRWETGVGEGAWSVVGVGCLVPRGGEKDEAQRRVIRDSGSTRGRKRGGKDDGARFILGYDGNGEYRLLVTTIGTGGATETGTESSGSSTLGRQYRASESLDRRPRPWVLKLASRLGLLAALCGFLILIVVYETATTTGAFGKFMNGRNFGSGFLFTGLGLVMDFFWDEFFSWTSMLEPYRRLALRPQPASTSILIPRATTALTGIWQAMTLGNVFGGTVAFASVLSKFTPIFLANIPFRLTLTWTMHRVCAWLSVAILSSMILVLVGSFFIRWPDLPVEPSTIAGSMYYVFDSDVLKDLEGMSLMGQDETERRLSKQGRKYYLSRFIDVSGIARVRIECVVNDGY
ncbi:hypothetical protein B0T14DRAFT_583265 [Immersiella caudata]|uniref:Uncharacterized protein n=1 Tax=Immersiella caudata TaxID=314043 RepID=A0AA39WYR8_9PEZI|nr:hypothetical protein B0T14DRAFT_583265 [Immersiella caudata]